MTKLNSSGDWIDYIYLSNTAGNKNCGFCIASRAGLRDSLFKIYDKYVEWKKIAEENHITSVKKTIPVSLPFATLYHYDGLQAVNHGFKKEQEGNPTTACPWTETETSCHICPTTTVHRT